MPKAQNVSTEYLKKKNKKIFKKAIFFFLKTSENKINKFQKKIHKI